MSPRAEFLHDLALEFGMPAGALARALPEREFIAWQHLAARRMLPTRKTHMLLAQIALWIARGAGAKDKTLSDFMLDPVDPTEAESLTVDDVAAQFDGIVIRVKKD